MRILVYNWHEPYICMFAATGHDFDVAPPKSNQGQQWRPSHRPPPGNVSLVSYQEAKDLAACGAYDLVLCLCLTDVTDTQDWPVPRLHIVVNMIESDAEANEQTKEGFLDYIKPLFGKADIAFSSEKKRLNWGWDARVVKHGIEGNDYGPYDGGYCRVLRVGNNLKKRGAIHGYSIQQAILGDDIPSTILGLNPDIPESAPSRDWEDLKEHYRLHRVMLSTLTDEHEDGYNCAVLEAMASGMPIVALANSSTPIVDGVNGFVSPDLGYLRLCLIKLLHEPALARELGSRARETVVEKFHIRDFVAGWNQVFDDCVAGRLEKIA
jgi:glycosyltransferase involved in cell wall biosynthesis